MEIIFNDINDIWYKTPNIRLKAGQTAETGRGRCPGVPGTGANRMWEMMEQPYMCTCFMWHWEPLPGEGDSFSMKR